MDFTTWVRSPAEAKDSSSSHCVHTSSEANLPSYPRERVSFPWGKVRPGRVAGYSPQFSTEVKNE
jgi:hypothetical protein